MYLCSRKGNNTLSGGALDLLDINEALCSSCIVKPEKFQAWQEGRLLNKVSNLGDKDFEEKINDVLEGGQSFYEVDSKLPQQIKDIIKRPV